MHLSCHAPIVLSEHVHWHPNPAGYFLVSLGNAIPFERKHDYAGFRIGCSTLAFTLDRFYGTNTLSEHEGAPPCTPATAVNLDVRMSP